MAEISVDVSLSPGPISCHPSEHVELAWKLCNVGSASWPDGLAFRRIDNIGSVFASASIEFPVVPAGCSVDVIVNALVPDKPGNYVLQYVLAVSDKPISSLVFDAVLNIGEHRTTQRLEPSIQASTRLHPLMGVRPGNHSALCKLHKVAPWTPAEPAPVVRDLEDWNITDDVELLPEVVESFRRTECTSNTDLCFHINGKPYTLSEKEVPIRESLAEFIRFRAGLTGTKICCGEGGCGACTVVLRYADGKIRLANACLKPVWSMDGIDVLTVEGVGSTLHGLDKIQQTIAKCDGSQCGMCTPGMVMSIYGFLNKSGQQPTAGVKAESCIQGNLCRCTGYRPIYKALQELCKSEVGSEAKADEGPTIIARRFCVNDGTALWLNCSEVADIFTALQSYPGRPFRLVVGNTSSGVVKYYPSHVNDKPCVYINVSQVAALRGISSNESSVVFGAAVTLSEIIEYLETIMPDVPGFQNIVAHLNLIAHPQVRDVASWTGNLVMAKTHKDFPSDVALLFTLLKGVLTIRDGSTQKTFTISVEDFLNGKDLQTSQIIAEISLPFPKHGDVVDSFKIMRRHMNTHAEVNAGFHFTFEDPSSTKISGFRAVYGNIDLGPLVCTKTPAVIVGQELSLSTLKQALDVLSHELVVKSASVPDPPFATVGATYRKSLALSLFYKVWLRAMIAKKGSAAVDARLQSAAMTFSRPMSSGLQQYEIEAADAPIHQPVSKVEAPEQTAGEVQYTGDMNWPARTCVAHPVLATQLAELVSIDASAALKIDGVVGFVSADTIKSIGAKNVVHGTAWPVFASGTIKYVGQIVGLVCASSHAVAAAGAAAVVVSYGKSSSSCLSSSEALTSGEVHEDSPIVFPVPVSSESARTISGEIKTTGQKHFYMETQTTFAVPDKVGGLVVTTSTQMLGGGTANGTQGMLSGTLNVPSSKIVVQVGAVGGAYGGKVFQYAPVCAAACVAALGLQRPVLLQLDRNSDCVALGGRPPCHAKWTTGFKDSGKITSLQQVVSADAGFDKSGVFTDMTSANVYDISFWSGKFSTEKLTMARPLNTIMRAPGEFQGCLFMEAVVEQVAREMQVEPWKVQEANMTDGPKPVWSVLKDFAQYDAKRKDADAFNTANRWRKRGVYMMAADYHLMKSEFYTGYYERCQVRVESDGVVTLAHSGIEMGQGINTKAAQGAAAALKAISSDFDVASVRSLPTKSTKDFSWSTVTPTFGSATSEAITVASLNACNALADKLSKYKGKPWRDVVASALADGVDMTAVGEHNRFSGNFGYHIYVAACASAEIDVLTGETQILSADIVYDAGKALNPSVDVGQIEGCFVQALGFCLTEQQVYSEKDGRLVNNGTWDYKIPSGQDIPIAMNVKLLPGTNSAHGNVKGSKATGEPAYCIGSVTYFAVKDAVYAARRDAGDSKYFQLDLPASPEAVQQACLVEL